MARVDHHVPVPQPKVRLVVLNYNGGSLTRRCLRHLEALDWPADRLDLVLVDNASTDGVVDQVRAEHPRVRVLETGANLGFPANNLGLGDLDGIDYVGLVNNDAFVEPGWLEPLVAALEADPELGAANSKILFAPRFRSVHLEAPVFRPGGSDPRELGVRVLGVRVDGEDRWRAAQLAGGCHGVEPSADGPFCWTSATGEVRVPDAEPPARVELRLAAPARAKVVARSAADEVVLDVGVEPEWFDVPLAGPAYDIVNNVGSVVFSDGSGADRGYLEVDAGQYDEPADVFAWCGASVLFRPSYLADIGLLEERFFMYYEDTDLSWRGRGAGWRHRYVPTSVIRHVHAATSVEGSELFVHHVERNRLLVLARCAPARLAVQQALRFVLSTASYARRDVLGPLRRRRRPSLTLVRWRVGAYLDFLSMLPWALRTRRQIRGRQEVPDEVLLAELVPR